MEKQVVHLSQDVETPSGKTAAQENFPVGSFLIRRDLRPHIHAFYRFARNADDIADSPTLAPAEKLSRLAVMQAVLQGRQTEGSPSALALRASLAATGTTDAHAEDLLHAFRQDAEKTRYASWDELLEYCRFSAMPVGRHVLDLHAEDPSTWAPSDALCASLQILNHLQDATKDLKALDRCYLPEDQMAEAGTTPRDLAGRVETRGLRTVFDSLLRRCQALNTEAADLPSLVQDRRLRLETAIILGLARRLTARLRRHDPVAGRVKLTVLDVVLSTVTALRYVW